MFAEGQGGLDKLGAQHKGPCFLCMEYIHSPACDGKPQTDMEGQDQFIQVAAWRQDWRRAWKLKRGRE